MPADFLLSLAATCPRALLPRFSLQSPAPSISFCSCPPMPSQMLMRGWISPLLPSSAFICEILLCECRTARLSTPPNGLGRHSKRVAVGETLRCVRSPIQSNRLGFLEHLLYQHNHLLRPMLHMRSL
eukprot:761260-Hanusia_phi.AAC.1